MNNEDLQAIALQASLGVGTYIVNDYLITVAQSEDGNGYTLTIRKGAEVQTIHLTELTQEYVDNCIQTALAEAKASGEFDGNGIERIVFNDDYTLTIYFTQTEPYTTGNIRGATGNGIQNIVLNDDYTLTINYTDGNSVTTDPIRGATGNGISGISFDSQNYTLTINFTDGESFTTGSIRGATGNGIASVRLNADYTLTITYTDGNSVTTSSIRGAKGDTGITPDISIGTVSTLAPNEPATAEITGTPEEPVLSLGIPKGNTGATPAFSIGTVTTLDPSEDATATISGTPEAPVLSLGIPQGIKGDTGEVSEEEFEAVIAPGFDASTAYTAGSYVLKNGVLYKFTAAHSGAWNGSDAEMVTVGGEITDLKADLEYLTVDLNHIKLKNATYYGITFSNMGNVCSISGTSTTAFTFPLGTFTPEIGKTYVFEANAEPVSTAWYLFLTGVNGTSTWYRTGETFTCTTDDVITVRILCKANATIDATVSPCIPEYPVLTAKYLDSKIDSGLDQITDINTEISEISSVLPHKEVKEIVIDADTERWESGYYYSGAVGSTIAKKAYDQLACRIYGNVSKGDKFEVTARSIGSGYAIILCDSSGKVIKNFTSPSNNGYYDLAEYTASADGVIYLNTAISGYIAGSKKYKLSKIESELAPVESSLNGVKWYSIGDSLNSFNATAEQNWIKYMIAGTGVENTNVAASGSGFYRGSPLDGYDQTNYIKQLESIESDAELITIAGSFNDLMTSPWVALPVGTASDTGTESIAGYMNTFFDTLISNFPNTAIAVVMTSPWDVFKPGVEKSDDYVSVLKTICEKHGIPFYSDCYYGCNLRPWNTANRTEYYTRSSGEVDGVHPNSKGHVFIYRMIRPFLEKVVHVLP